MRRLALYTLIIALSNLFFTNTRAQINAQCEIRPRTELRDGYKVPADMSRKPSLLTTQRSRLGIRFDKEKLAVFISGQDIRVWGEVKNKVDFPSINLHEAWAELKISNEINIKAGRQMLKYDDERLLSENNWNNVGSSHDLLLGKYRKNSTQIHLGLAFNNDNDNYSKRDYHVEFYKTMGFLWAEYITPNAIKTSAVFIADGNEAENNPDVLYVRATAGLNAEYKSDSTKHELKASGYYQFGSSPDGKDISAYMASIGIGYKAMKKLSIRAGADVFSGNKFDVSKDATHAFSNLYGAGHKYLGYMDYFTVPENSTKGYGLLDAFLSIQVILSKKIKTEIAVHQFETMEQITYFVDDEILMLDKNLGEELDFSLCFKLNDNSDIKAGYSLYYTTESLKYLIAGEANRINNWGWVMMTIKI